jgi:pyruvate formate lyase activating enzyme
MHFTAFHPDWRLRDVRPTPPKTLARAREIALRNGVRYAYTGNVWDPAGNSTVCHDCGAVVIGRNGYRITAWGLDADGDCRACGAACAGVFDGIAGNWGARREPVRI